MLNAIWPEQWSKPPAGLLPWLDLAAIVLFALILHALAFWLLRRLLGDKRQDGERIVIDRISQPIRWIAMLLAVSVARRSIDLTPEALESWRLAEGLALPALLAWLIIAILRGLRRIVELRSDIAVADNLAARRRRTRANILTRIAIFLVIFIAAALMLLAIPSVRNIGVSLLASAGLAGLAVGAAAQPALKNLIAGVQMAFTEPIKIDDAIIIAGEWGWVEEIRLTYVVVKVWDERRLIVPVSKFLEEPFQNWTFRNADMLGSIFLWLDPMADIARLRAHFEAMIGEEPLWDGRARVLQVTDTKPDAIEIRMLATAKDSPTAFDLRCSIREKMLAFVRDNMPEALPRTRNRIESIENSRTQG